MHDLSASLPLGSRRVVKASGRYRWCVGTQWLDCSTGCPAARQTWSSAAATSTRWSTTSTCWSAPRLPAQTNTQQEAIW